MICMFHQTCNEQYVIQFQKSTSNDTKWWALAGARRQMPHTCPDMGRRMVVNMNDEALWLYELL